MEQENFKGQPHRTTYIKGFLILNMSILSAILKNLSANIMNDDDHMLILNATTPLHVLNFTVILLSFSCDYTSTPGMESQGQ